MSQPDTNPVRLLLVDDNNEFRFLLGTLLPRLFSVTIAKSLPSPREALAYLESNQVDLVIADLRMPGMTGIDFIKEARLLESPPKVVLATFNPSPAVEEAAFAAGAIGVLSKSEIQEELAEFLPPLS